MKGLIISITDRGGKGYANYARDKGFKNRYSHETHLIGHN